jgi:ligand-binding sensor domain-containing protein
MVALETQASQPTFRSDPEYLIDTWETEDGLPENSATAMVQTADGYLWFGTWNGLVRFDGVRFAVFNPGNTPQLPNAGIVNLHADRREQLWLSTLAGLVMRKGTEWRSFGTNEGWAGNFVRTFAERTNGDLLLTTFDGHVLEFVGDRLKELPHPPSPADLGLFGAVDESGQWWVTDREFAGRWDGQRWIRTYTPDRSQDPGVPSLSARDGGIWILSGKELLKFRQGAEVSRVFLPQLPTAIWSLSEDSRTNVWIGSYNEGLFRLDPRGSLKHWTTTNGLANLGCRFIVEDREGNLWVGMSRGLSRFKPRRARDLDRERLLSERLAKSVWPARDGSMWVATYDQGLFRYDALDVSPAGVPESPTGHLTGFSVLEDHAGRVWYRGNDACWWRRGPAGFEKAPLTWAQDANGRALFEDSKERIWISAWQGVALFEGKEFHEFGSQAGLPTGGVTCFGEDHAGVPWVAAEAGVFRFEKDRFIEVSALDTPHIREVECFWADPDGPMWMGTKTRGLLRLRDARLSTIGPPLGFPVEAVHAIIADDRGYFWMPSNRGIVRASRRDLRAVADGARDRLDCQLLDRNDGLPSVACSPSQPSCARDRSGRLWFATERGVVMIDPAAFRLNSQPPPLTGTERRVLLLVAENETNKEIAAELFISPRTIETHRSNICQKLQLEGSHKLLQFAIEHRSEI